MTSHLNAATSALIHVSQLSTVNVGKRQLFVGDIYIFRLHSYCVTFLLGIPITACMSSSVRLYHAYPSSKTKAVESLKLARRMHLSHIIFACHLPTRTEDSSSTAEPTQIVVSTIHATALRLGAHYPCLRAVSSRPVNTCVTLVSRAIPYACCK